MKGMSSGTAVVTQVRPDSAADSADRYSSGKSKRGGARAGAGRPKGRKTVCRSVSMSIEDWARLDDVRGDYSRSQWLRMKVAETLLAIQAAK